MTVPETVLLRYAEHYHPGSLLLLTVPPELESALDPDSGEAIPLWIRGGQDEETTLCTQDQTYAIHVNDTSNALMLLTPGPMASSNLAVNPAPCRQGGPAPTRSLHVVDTCDTIMELRRTPPRLTRLPSLFVPSLFPDHPDLPEYGVSWEELVSEIGASDHELHQALRQMHIIQFSSGKYRRLTLEYVEESLQLLVSCLALLKIPFDHISPARCRHALCGDDADMPYEVLLHIVDSMGSCISQDQEDIWALDQDKVCRFLGERLFQTNANVTWNESEFIAAWAEACPHPFIPNIAVLKSCTARTQDQDTLVTSLRYINPIALPVDPAARFHDLFAIQARWPVADIAPFILPIVVKDADVDRLVRTWGRIVNVDGVKWVSSRIIS